MVGTISQQAGTFVHELGHNLNLRHGGQDNVNRKPNYISVMNYAFQLGGIPPHDPDGPGPLIGRIDYSRAALPTLLETESRRARRASAPGATTRSTTARAMRPRPIVGNDPVDWNCNDTTQRHRRLQRSHRRRPLRGPGDQPDLRHHPGRRRRDRGRLHHHGRPTALARPRPPATMRRWPSPATRSAPSWSGWNDWANLRYPFHNTFGFVDGDQLDPVAAGGDRLCHLRRDGAGEPGGAGHARPATAGPGSTVTLRVRGDQPPPRGRPPGPGGSGAAAGPHPRPRCSRHPPGHLRHQRHPLRHAARAGRRARRPSSP